MLLAAVALVGILVIAAIFFGQRQVEADYRAAADLVTEKQAKVAAMTASFRDSLLWEQDFLLHKQPASVDKFKAAAGAARAILEGLRSSADAGLAGKLDRLASGLGAYEAGFATLVKDNQDLGLDQDSGLQGAMRSAVHSIEDRLETVEDAEIRASMLMMRRHEKDFLLRGDAIYIEKHAAEAEHFTALVKKAFKPGAQRTRVTDALDVYLSAFKLYAEAGLREEQSRQRVSDAYRAVEPLVGSVLSDYAAEKSETLAENQRVAARNLVFVVGLLIGAVVVLLLSVWLIGRSITRPVVAVTAAMRTLAGGVTDIAVPGLGRANEFGAMAQALETFRQAAIANRRLEEEAAIARANAESERRRMHDEAEAEARERLMRATDGLATGLRRLAEGDLAFELTEAFAPDFEALRDDLNQTIRRLADVMQAIARSSASIDGGSREISQSADDLSRRTEQQAASLEETAAALDEITANVGNSSRRAQEALAVATEANASAARTSRLVDDAVEAMRRIEQSSERISSIIGVIDGIAFQTNLLALNAGVEAARAGEAGRGFAVVAHEVRELAGRSAAAAREIKQLIQASGEEVKGGVRFVRDTGEALREIGGHVQAINTQVEAIAVSSREQSLGLEEINSAVNQLDQGTQQNAAMVEENNAASAVLMGEAARLRELLEMFRLSRDEDSRRKSGAAPRQASAA
ncbi:methyl-accepting chemotaxis protein [Caulobacter sp. D4A]|uniref:methyl-accepting chemotaxis protein n=1 Tax=Caulobacter sp. D4A TaxID=2204171 RepID=UPI000D7316EB|nr:HAMP domain-containing methyl-accepting chemotaxis protein [Caulobacter sp. D4A]PXA88004.1 methyl-accepting chemotaxis protein [Caulobacter sp. D4A]